MAINPINIVPDVTQITITTDDKKLVISGDVVANNVNVSQPLVNTIKVQVPGPQGPVGPVGPEPSTGSLMVTGSVSNNTLTFTKGDGSTFDLTPNSGSFSGSFEGTFTRGRIGDGVIIEKSSTIIRSEGFLGQTSASLGLSPAGFVIYSGSSATTLGADTLQGTGFKFVGPNNSSSISFTDQNDGDVEIKTDKFTLQNSGDITASNALFSGTAIAQNFLQKSVVVHDTVFEGNPSNFSNYFDQATLSTYNLVLDGGRGGEILNNVEFKLDESDVVVDDIILLGDETLTEDKAQVTLRVRSDSARNLFFNLRKPDGSSFDQTLTPGNIYTFEISYDRSGTKTTTALTATDLSIPVTASSTGYNISGNINLGGSITATNQSFFEKGIFLNSNFRIDWGGSNNYIAGTQGGVGAGNIRIQTGGSERIRVIGTGEVGIGTTSPSHTLDVSGSARFTDGIEVTGSTIHNGDLTVKGIVTAEEFHTEFISASIIYRSGSTKFGDTSDDVHQFTGSIQQSGSNSYLLGRIGIGTTSPTQTLDVSGSVIIRPDNTTDTISFLSLGSNQSRLFTTNNFAIWPGGSEAMRLLSNGNVGIGTTSPTEKLDVVDAIRIDGTTNAHLFIDRSSTNRQAHIEFTTANSLDWSMGSVDTGDFSGAVGDEFFIGDSVSTPRFLINSSGNVGIGTTSPRAKLDIQDSTHGTLMLSKPSETGYALISGSSGLGFEFKTYDAGEVTAMKIANDGNVGIGTTNPATKLTVNGGNIRRTHDANNYSQMGAGGAGGFINGYNGGTERFIIRSYASSGVQAFFTAGNVGIGTTSPSELLHLKASQPTLAIQHSNRGLYDSASIEFREYSDNYVAKISTAIYNDGAIRDADFKIETTTNGTSSLKFLIDHNGDIDITPDRDFSINSNDIYVSQSGNVGIGTTSPTRELTVNGDIGVKNNGKLYLWDSHNLNYIQYDEWRSYASSGMTIANYSGDLSLQTLSNTRLFISSSGNVGIGTTTPEATLHINDINPRYIRLQDRNYIDQYADIQFAEGSLRFRADDANNRANSFIAFDIDNVERARITSDGNVGIGTTSPSEKLTVDGNISGSGNLYIDGIGINTSSIAPYSFLVKGSGYITNVFQVDGNTGIGGTLGLDGGSGGTYPLTYQYRNSVFGKSNILQFRQGGSTPQAIVFSYYDINPVLSMIPNTADLAKVGINNIDPQYSLDVSGSGNFTDGLTVTGSLQQSGSDSYLLGNVGIGTTSPSKTLDVDGTFRTSGEAFLSNFDNTTSNSRFRDDLYLNYGTDRVFRIGYNSTTDKLQFGSGSNAIMTLDGDGNLVVEGSTKFGNDSNDTHIFSGSLTQYTSATRYIKLRGGSGDLQVVSNNNTAPVAYIKGTGTADLLNVFDNTTEVFTILDGGNVGIGTTSPSYKLDVRGPDSSTATIKWQNTNRVAGYLYSDGGGAGMYVNSLANTGIYFFDSSRIDFRVGGSERMRITSTGNIGIGTTSPSYTLDVSGSGNFTDGLDVTGSIRVDSGDLVLGNGKGVYFDNGTGPKIIESSNGIQFWANGAGTDKFMEANGHAQLTLYTHEVPGTDNALRIDKGGTSTNIVYVSGSGEVGIGTTSPQAKLHVSGTSDVFLVEGSGSTLMSVDGVNGRLFEVTDDLSDSLFSVNTIAGLPVLEVFADNTIKMGAFNQSDLVVTSSNVGIGTDAPTAKLHVSGTVQFDDILSVTPQDPLPSGVPTGSFAVSSSAPPKPYFYDGTNWNALY